MKNALILHGTDFHKTLNERSGNWFPWLKKELEKRRYEVFLPELPQAWEPDNERYWNFLKKKFDFNKDSVVIGHSSGAVAILGILDSLPDYTKINSVFLVAGFIKDRGWGCEGLFVPDFDWDDIKNKSERFYVIHSNDDPYCPLGDAKQIAKNLGTKVILKKGHKHFSVSIGGEKFRKLPFILKLLEEK